MSKTLKMIHWLVLLLFGIALKATLIFYASTQLLLIDHYMQHLWLNFALDSVAIAIGFNFLIKKVNKTWARVLLAVAASAYTYICVLAEDLICDYQYFSRWGGYDSGVFSVTFNNMHDTFLNSIIAHTPIYLRTFVLLTAVLCTISILLSDTGDGECLIPPLKKKRIWRFTAISIAIGCYLKYIAYHYAYKVFYDPIYRFFDGFLTSEKLSYLLDIAIFLLIYELLYIRIKKPVWKIVSGAVLSGVATGVVMLENISYLYKADVDFVSETGINEVQYIIRYFTPAFTTVRPPYILVTLGFILVCALISVCHISAVREKLLSVWKRIASPFILEPDDDDEYDDEYDEGDEECFDSIERLRFKDADGNIVTARTYMVTSILIKGEGVNETVFVRADFAVKDRFYMCHLDEDGYLIGNITVIDGAKEMYQAYSNLILQSSAKIKDVENSSSTFADTTPAVED